MTEKKTKEQKLFTVASVQLGYFTSKQARECGYAKNNHPYYVKTKKWIKENIRGIYRIHNYPVSEYEELMVYYLWTCNISDKPRGVYSHQTALSLYDLSDANPSKLYMTVPNNFKKNKTPSILKLFKKDLPEIDIASFYGVKITTPIRTLIDVIDDDSIQDFIKEQTVNEAYHRGLIIKNQIDANPKVKLLLKIK